MATYRGTDITPGTDAQVAAQVAAVDSAKYQQPGAPAKISVAGLTDPAPAPAKVIQPPPATASENLGGTITANADAFQANLDAKAKAAETASAGSLTAYVDRELGGATQGELTNAAYAQTVDPAQAELRDINQQITAEQHGLERQLQALDKNSVGYTTAGIADEKQRLTNASVARQADLSIIQLAKQGKFDSAKQIADRAVQMKFEREQLTNDALKFNYEQNKDLFNKADQRAFETAQSKREADLNFERQKEMAKYEQTIKQNDPLYKAQIANIYSEIGARNASASGGADVLAYTQALEAGSATLAQIPQKIRGQVLANVQATGTNKLLGLLGQYRDTVGGLNFFTANTPGNKALLNTLKGQITAVYKQQQQLGTLDNGVQVLVDRIIPDPSQLSISSLSNKAQIAAIDNFIANQTSKAPAATASGGPETDSAYAKYLKAIGH